jgi:hypothetical protein
MVILLAGAVRQQNLSSKAALAAKSDTMPYRGMYENPP